VNIGSWLVLEKWMTPSVFSGVPGDINDEYQLTRYLGYDAAEQRLRRHWDTWFTESDVIALKNAGINHLRIPIGYWAFDIKAGEPWVRGSWDYVMRACGWAKTHGLKVMVDLHGAPGSQNGNDHSGQSGPTDWYYNDENLDRSVRVIGEIAKVANTSEWRDTITIIQLLNEPVLWDDYGYRLSRLQDYYRRSYDEVRRYNDIAVVAVHDAFIALNNWFYFRDDPHYFWVMLDTHLYQVFSPEWANLSCQEHARLPCRVWQTIPESNDKLWTVVGEWSLATPNPCNNQADFAKHQIGIYERGSGWFMWSFKHEQGWQEWSFLDSHRNGWINLQQDNTVNC